MSPFACYLGRPCHDALKSRHWRELLDPERHTDWMSTSEIGGRPAEAPRDPLIEAWAYFVEVAPPSGSTSPDS